ncbi:MAG: hypothetical protein ACJAQ4_001338 [Cryomorphaceae bacterium]|jgi:hypothetical protein
MNISELTELSSSELRVVSKKNLCFFAFMTALDLALFYYSLFMDQWLTMFLSLGFFIACLALHDNYQFTRELAIVAETVD